MMLNRIKANQSENKEFKRSSSFSFVIIFGLLILFSQLTYSRNNITQSFAGDSIRVSMQDSMSNLATYDSDYIQKSEIEHQKLIRNIFAVSFIAVLALLLFTMFFYGSKIKKISNIIVLQDDALKSTKDQLIKIIGIFNHIDQQVYITDSDGNIEWANTTATNILNEKYEETKISIIEKFNKENREILSKAIGEQKEVHFVDNLFPNYNKWKMIPVKNSKGEFSNMVFIC